MQSGQTQVMDAPQFANYSISRNGIRPQEIVPDNDGSPEVEFGAFLRNNHPPRPPPASSAPTTSSAFSQPEPRQVTKNGRPAQSVGRMRQGAPRLGGLGLGGIVAPTPAQATPPARVPTPPLRQVFPTYGSPPSPGSPGNKVKRKPVTRKRSRSPPLAKAPATLQPPLVERPFLSPEMAKPTVREGAFALDRPVPEAGLPPVVAAPEEILSPSPTFSPHFESSPESTQHGWRKDSGASLQELLSTRAMASGGPDFGGITEQDHADGYMDEGVGRSSGEETRDGIYATPDSERGDPFEEAHAFTPASSLRATLHSHSTSNGHAATHDDTESISSFDDEPALDGSHQRHSTATTESSVEPQTPIFLSTFSPPIFDDEQNNLHTTQPLRLKSAASPPRIVTPPESHGSISSSGASHHSSGRDSSFSRTRGPPPPRPPRRRDSPNHPGRRGSSTNSSDDGGSHTASPSLLGTTTNMDERASFESGTSSGFSDGSRSESFFFRPPPLPARSSSISTQGSPAAAPIELVSPPIEAPVRKERPPSWYGLGLRMPSSLKPSTLNATTTDPGEAPLVPRVAEVPVAKPETSSIPVLPPPIEILPKPKKPALSKQTSLKRQKEKAYVEHIDVSSPPAVDPIQPPTITRAVLPTPSPSPPLVDSRSRELPALAPETLPTDLPPPIAMPTSPKPATTPHTIDIPPTPLLPVEEGLVSPRPGDKDVLQQMEESQSSVGMAVAGAVFSGTVAVGYGAWRGLSAVASVGWSWSTSAREPLKEEEVSVQERPSPYLPLPGSFEKHGEREAEAEAATSAQVPHQEETARTKEEPSESSNMSTEWGEFSFPAPDGFIEAFKQAMEELGPEDIESNERMEQEAQEAAYRAATQLHDETFSPKLEDEETLPTLSQHLAPTSIEQWRVSSSEYARSLDGSEHDEYDSVAPMLSDRQSPVMRSRFVPPPGLQGAPSPSFQRQQSFSPSVASIADSDKSDSRSIFSFRKNKKGRHSSPASQPPVPSLHQRSSSVFSNDSNQSSSKVLRRKSLPFGGKAPAPEPEIEVVNYVSYSSGRNARRRDSNASSGSDPVVQSPVVASRLLPGGRRSSLRAESRYSESRSKKKGPVMVEEKKMYRVRFANATLGLGLRSVAEDEAERAGGESHAMKWIGVGRGRYGNMVLQTDESSDMLYAEQTALIKKKWRSFGAEQQRDWANVKID